MGPVSRNIIADFWRVLSIDFLNDSSSYRLKPGQVPLAENDCDITTVPGEMISSETLQMCVRRDEFIVRSLQYRRPVTLRNIAPIQLPPPEQLLAISGPS